MKAKNLIKVLAILALIFLPIISSYAQDTVVDAPKQKVKLGVRKIEPFVTTSKDNKYSGFSIDLWDQLAKDSNIETTEIKEYPNVDELLKAVENKEVDAAIAAISITADRENRVDFTTPMYNSGLSIMTKTDTKPNSVIEIFNQIKQAVFNNDFAALGTILAVISFILANLLYFIEKRKDDGFLDTKNYLGGISLAFWWGVTALFGQQDRQPATKIGRFIGVLWMIFGVLFLSFFTAQITSNLTADKISGNISNIKDLKGKKIATVFKSTAQNYLVNNDYILAPKEVQDQNQYLKMSLSEAGELLKNDEVVAVVYDGPALDYYVKSKGEGNLQTVGGLFTAENYGIALPSKSELRKTLNLNLLKVQENGFYNELKTKYFGDSN
jgi:polar amino acid transport system substrate-binding protein